jgi:hypothetical protein
LRAFYLSVLMFKLLIMKGIKYKYLELKDLDNGGFFTFKPNSKTVWIKEEYCHSSKKWSCKKWHDINHENFFSGNRKVFAELDF